MNGNWDHLADYLSWLHDQGDLARISGEVDPVHELTEILQRVCRGVDGGPVVIFESVKGSPIPVVSNLLGAERRVRHALRAESFDEAGRKLIGRLQTESPRSWWDFPRLLPHWMDVLGTQPVVVKSAACQHMVRIGRDLNLSRLPIPHFWPQESGPSITAGQLCYRHPDSGDRGSSLVALEVLSEDRLRIHWPPYHPACRWQMIYQRQQRQMPLAVVLGGDPLLPFLSAVPLPEGIDPYLLGGFLRGKAIELIPCRTQELDVPANAEIVLEGMLEWEDNRHEAEAGQLVTQTGWLNPPRKFPVMQVTAVTQRANPHMPVIVHGGTGHEDYWIGKAIERIQLPFVKLFLPEIIDWHFPRSGRFHHVLFVKFRKEYPEQARKVMQGIWSLFPAVHAKMLFVLDDDVDISDEQRVWSIVGARLQPRRDINLADGPRDAWDPSGGLSGLGQCVGFDVTRKWEEEGGGLPAAPLVEMDPRITQRVTERWNELTNN